MGFHRLNGKYLPLTKPYQTDKYNFIGQCYLVVQLTEELVLLCGVELVHDDLPTVTAGEAVWVEGGTAHQH